MPRLSEVSYVDVVAMLAVLQYLWFGKLVGQARVKYGVRAPATTGSDQFERAYRVQMNTLELLVGLLPGLYVAAKYWPEPYVASVGVVYLIGRVAYRQAYVAAPETRNLGFAISVLPVFALVLATLVAVGLRVSAA
jgi:glutathione S-transferase